MTTLPSGKPLISQSDCQTFCINNQFNSLFEMLLSAGSNAHGQLANGTLDDSYTFQKCKFEGRPDCPHARSTRVLDIASGANHTVVLLHGEGPEVWGSGDGRKGQLGLNYQREAKGGQKTATFRRLNLSLSEFGLENHTFKSIAATWETTYIALSCEGKGDVLISMGSDDYGDLGIGNGRHMKDSPSDFHVVSFGHLSTPSGIQLLPGNIRIDAVYSGQRHIILSLGVSGSDGLVEPLLVGWGTSRHGQLGSSTSGKALPFTSEPTIIPIPPGADPIVSASLGIHHTILSHRSGCVSALGANRKHQLQLLQEVKRAESIGCTWNGTYAVVQDSERENSWTIISSGSNSHSQLGWDPESEGLVGAVRFTGSLDRKTVTKIACGSEHVLLLLRDAFQQTGEVWGWGWNEHGNLGVGNTKDVPTPTCIWPPAAHTGAAVTGIWAGCGTSWINVEDD